MLKKTITYVDPFSEQKVSEDHYFHLSKADIIHMELGKQGGGLKSYIERIVAAEDAPKVMELFRDIIARSYGKRIDGRFIKNKELSDEFLASEAYGELLMEMLTDPSAAATFVAGIAPKNVDEIRTQANTSPAMATVEQVQAEHEAKADPTGLTETVTPRVLTQQEIVEMDSEQLKAGLADGSYKLAP